VVKNSWNTLSTQQQQTVVQHIHQEAQTADFSSMVTPVRTQFAYALSDVTIAAGKEAIEHTVSKVVVQLVQKGVLQATLHALAISTERVAHSLHRAIAHMMVVPDNRSPYPCTQPPLLVCRPNILTCWASFPTVAPNKQIFVNLPPRLTPRRPDLLRFPLKATLAFRHHSISVSPYIATNTGRADAHAAFISSKVAQYLSEELGEGTSVGKRSDGGVKADGDSISARRRTLLAAMTQHGAALLGLQIESASHYLQAGMQQVAALQGTEAVASQAAITAALEAMSAFVTWLPMGTLRGSALVDACAMLVQTEDFQALVVEILLQVRQVAQFPVCIHSSVRVATPFHQRRPHPRIESSHGLYRTGMCQGRRVLFPLMLRIFLQRLWQSLSV
jgi:hypothetical protein